MEYLGLLVDDGNNGLRLIARIEPDSAEFINQMSQEKYVRFQRSSSNLSKFFFVLL
jgi:hypothetical protein